MSKGGSFRFFNNREKYLLFTTTCSEKLEVAKRVGRELDKLEPSPPALRVFQVGVGEGSQLNGILRQMHHRWPNVPLVVVVKESSAEFIRMAIRNLADRFSEHPHMVLVFTNVPFKDGPWNAPTSAWTSERLGWRDVALPGTSSQAFDARINEEINFINEAWETAISPSTGNLVSVRPSAMVLYRADHQFALDDVIPTRNGSKLTYDLAIAPHPYRASLPTQAKVRQVLAPLAKSLAAGGRLTVIQATGRDPGMEIIRRIWPGESPFESDRNTLLSVLAETLGTERYEFVDPGEDAEFQYHLQLNPNDVDSNIGTSTLLAAWNAATYVAQIDEGRLSEAIQERSYVEVTDAVLHEHNGLWFSNESFVVVRR